MAYQASTAATQVAAADTSELELHNPSPEILNRDESMSLPVDPELGNSFSIYRKRLCKVMMSSQAIMTLNACVFKPWFPWERGSSRDTTSFDFSLSNMWCTI